MTTFKREEKLFLVFTVLFCVIVVLSNLITSKIFYLPTAYGGMALPAGLLTYPLAFSLSDLTTEIYGLRRARFIILAGFAVSFVAYAVVQLAIFVPPHELWAWDGNPWGYESVQAYQVAYESVFSTSGIALGSSLLAYTVGQFLDVGLYAWIRGKTGEPHMWLRTIVSTLVSQAVDTFIVNIILLQVAFNMEGSTLFITIATCFAYKAFFAVVNVPLFYLSVGLSRRYIAGTLFGHSVSRQPS